MAAKLTPRKLFRLLALMLVLYSTIGVHGIHPFLHAEAGHGAHSVHADTTLAAALDSCCRHEGAALQAGDVDATHDEITCPICHFLSAHQYQTLAHVELRFFSSPEILAVGSKTDCQKRFTCSSLRPRAPPVEFIS